MLRSYLIGLAAGQRGIVPLRLSEAAWPPALRPEPHRSGKRIGLELSATTLTGPAIAELLLPPGDVGAAFADASDDVLWCDPAAVGFVAVAFTRDTVSAEFVRVLNPRDTTGRLDVAKRATAKIGIGGLEGWQVS